MSSIITRLIWLAFFDAHMMPSAIAMMQTIMLAIRITSEYFHMLTTSNTSTGNIVPLNGDYYDPKMTYSFNPYTRVLLSLRGDLRKYHGAAFPSRSSYALGPKDKDAAKITNRRIRRHALDEDMSSSYSYCKKLYGPLIDEIW